VVETAVLAGPVAAALTTEIRKHLVKRHADEAQGNRRPDVRASVPDGIRQFLSQPRGDNNT